MRKQYYELHITCEGDPKIVAPLVESIGWKFSAIDKDIVLGDGVKCYATRHLHIDTPDVQISEALLNNSNILMARGVKVVRRKIEKVVFDELIK